MANANANPPTPRRGARIRAGIASILRKGLFRILLLIFALGALSYFVLWPYRATIMDWATSALSQVRTMSFTAGASQGDFTSPADVVTLRSDYQSLWTEFDACAATDCKTLVRFTRQRDGLMYRDWDNLLADLTNQSNWNNDANYHAFVAMMQAVGGIDKMSNCILWIEWHDEGHEGKETFKGFKCNPSRDEVVGYEYATFFPNGTRSSFKLESPKVAALQADLSVKDGTITTLRAEVAAKQQALTAAQARVTELEAQRSEAESGDRSLFLNPPRTAGE